MIARVMQILIPKSPIISFRYSNDRSCQTISYTNFSFKIYKK